MRDSTIGSALGLDKVLHPYNLCPAFQSGTLEPQPPLRHLVWELGLEVAPLDPIGWSATSVPSRPSPATPRCWPIWLRRWSCGVGPSRPARLGRVQSGDALACSCACGRRIRVARSVMELAPILCGVCAQPFQPEDDQSR